MEVYSTMLDPGSSPSSACVAGLVSVSFSPGTNASRPHLPLTYSGVPVWKRIVELPAASDKQISLIKAMFSDHDEVEEAKNLGGDDAQSFIEAMDEVHSTFPSVSGEAAHVSLSIRQGVR